MEKIKNCKTAEFVSPMHPDKICDRISASILDECLKQDPKSRVAVETLGGHKKIVVMGEITSNAVIDVEKIVEKEIGNKEFEILVNVDSQSREISRGVDAGGAGDQGIMIGYACSDNEELVPLEYYYARGLCKYIFNKYPYDGKAQITIYENAVTDVVVSFQNVSKGILRQLTLEWLKQMDIQYDVKLWINEAGDGNIGGFDADTGLTGRKIVIDSYGPRVSVGGGAFSGKDPTKVDLSGALMARKLAVDILNRFDELYSVTIRVAYAIGKKEPVMLEAEVVYKEPITDNIRTNFNILNRQMRALEGPNAMIERFYPENITKELDLLRPQYKQLSQGGHFGNNNLGDR